MRRVATAFIGSALFGGGLGASSTFAAEKPQTSAGPSIDPISAVLEDAVGQDGRKSANPLNHGTDAQARPGNAHEFSRATTSFSMGYFTTSRRKFRKHFS